jgi:hypothetical protein
MKKSKSPRELNLPTYQVVALSSGQVKAPVSEYNTKNVHAVALGRLGGLKGGMARAKKLTKAQRIKIALKAAKARWNKGTAK